MDPAVFDRRHEQGKTHLTKEMGVILTDWLIEVREAKKISQSAYDCAISIMDRCLSTADISRSKLQLLGITALLIGYKFYDEDNTEPAILDPRKCAHLTDNAYTRQEVITMERTILQTLDYRVRLPLQLPQPDTTEKTSE